MSPTLGNSVREGDLLRDFLMLSIFKYESLKSAWINAHPESTPAEYEAAMREIAQEVGI